MRVMFPSLPALFPSALVADDLYAPAAAASRMSPRPAIYQEPSLVFLLGTDTRFTDGAGAAEFLRRGRAILR